MASGDRPQTPDGRYFVAKGRLWRRSDPQLSEEERRAAVSDLMAARRAVGRASGPVAERSARSAVDAAKRRLGERGPVWWRDGAPDETGRAPCATRYAAWWDGLHEAERKAGRK